jgi:hypothetical protein
MLLFKLLFPEQLSRAASNTSSEQPAVINPLDLGEPGQVFIIPLPRWRIGNKFTSERLASDPVTTR